MKRKTNKLTRKNMYGLILLALFGLLITSCSKDDGDGIEPLPDPVDNVASALEFNNLRDDALNNHIEQTTFNAEDGIIFTSNDGAAFEISPNCLTRDGDLATGPVELTFIDLYEKGDMATTNKPTMGYKENGDKAPLVTGGEFFVEIRQDGELLDLGCNFRITVPVALTGGIDPDMVLWNGIIDDDGDLTWEEVDDDIQAGVFAEGDFYRVFNGEFGWTNIDKFYGDPRPKTTLKVEVPAGFKMENSAVYLSYDGEPHMLAKLDIFKENGNYFTEHYGQIPLGIEAHLVFLTAQDDEWRYAIKGVTIAENDVYSFTLEETEVDGIDNVIAAINNLP